jgi:hypothetical protein
LVFICQFTTDFAIDKIKTTINSLNIPNLFDDYVFSKLNLEERYRASGWFYSFSFKLKVTLISRDVAKK